MSIVLLAAAVIVVLNVFIVKSALKSESVTVDQSVKEDILDDGEIDSL